jgi:hypothetical protein
VSTKVCPIDDTVNVFPIVLLDAYGNEVDDDEKDLEKLHYAYSFSNTRWCFSSNYVIEQIFKKYGRKADVFAEKMYFSLSSQSDSSSDSFIDQLFRNYASDMVLRHGLFCEKVSNDKEEKLEVKSMHIKVTEILKCSPQLLVQSIVHKCTHANIFYDLVNKNHQPSLSFDAFVAPNNFISFTENSVSSTCRNRYHMLKPKPNPILLSEALLMCESTNNVDSHVNFITAVPAVQKEKWTTARSFEVNIDEEVKWIQKNKDEKFQFGGQRMLTSLSPCTLQKLKKFHQFVGVVEERKKISFFSSHFVNFCKKYVF